MQQELYPNHNILYQRRYLICAMLEVRYGGPVVCFLWMVINMYACVLSFQKRSPIYSYLNSTAVIIQGVVCLWFVISALVSLYSFSLARPRELRLSHQLTWGSVILFLVVYFINMIIFGVQKPQFQYWCMNKSRQDTHNYLFSNPPTNNSLILDSQLIYTTRGPNAYNCTRLWEDEIKFSVVVFVILFFCYVQWAFCFWKYTQDTMRIYETMAFNMAAGMANNTMMQNNTMMMPGTNMMHNSNNNNNILLNIKPGSKTDILGENNDDGQKSLAQLARVAFGRLRA